MTRSFINKTISQAIEFLNERKFYLPEWAYWTYEQWKAERASCGEIFETKLGWDVTDSGGEFDKNGLVLFTVRNGVVNKSRKQYCEKILLMKAGQVCPYHYHKVKSEDIINRGEGELAFCLAKAEGANNEKLSAQDIVVTIDGRDKRFRAGEEILLRPGQSLSLYPFDYHKFYPLASQRGLLLIGEVSSVNDDATDNFFLERVTRFPSVEEDEPIRYPIVGDYTLLR